MKHFDWKIIGIIGIVVFSFLILFFGYQVSVGNTATRMEEQISESYSGIEIQQKHRNDSVKQLVQVVENFTSHEQDIVNSVTDARAKLQEGDVSGALKSLNVVVENYPEIKSDLGRLPSLTCPMSISLFFATQHRYSGLLMTTMLRALRASFFR